MSRLCLWYVCIVGCLVYAEDIILLSASVVHLQRMLDICNDKGSDTDIIFTRATRSSAVYATATWLAGWVSVTRRYCIKRAKPILKLFQQSGRPIILVSSDFWADTQFQGEPLQRGLNTQGVRKIGDFDGNHRLSRKRCEIGRWLL